jgi:hypothetical protein
MIQGKLSEVYPNIFTLQRIITTLPVSTATAERSFSKLQLINTSENNGIGTLIRMGHYFIDE